ncbi:2-dehydropantoate 2-reductase [Kineococcus radiotolerans]|uniref:2-dehydropantoate 2-reductase n=1 Tax=Kineococcus radiotolerans TaxID=131568 RepID=A0A7W4TQL5_KINRA|nr:2-dehydropantoate 2-reductase N-terminal domain-containing protein [Kineococcus radiotolerans]MBB2902651.1 2-dehydropantoate 2-reductase [Kineococcus radiotolerans]
MRYVVIGAGAIGGTIGGRLGQHGHEVVLVARGAHADHLREKGLRLLTPTGPVELNAPVASSPADVALTPDDVLVLAVKVQDASGLLADWAAAPVGGSTAGHVLPVVCAQNGVEGERLALRWFRRVVGACVFLPASHLEPGVVSSEGVPVSGGFVLGRYPRGRDELVEEIAADLAGAGFATAVSDDVMAAKRGKLLENTGNALDAVCRPGEGVDALREEARAEGERVLRAAGTPPLDRAAALPQLAALGFRTAPVAGAERLGSSSWQSLHRGGSVETDWLNGEVVRLGREHGVPTPVNEALQVLADASVREGLGPRAFGVGDVRALAAAAAGASGDPAGPA